MVDLPSRPPRTTQWSPEFCDQFRRGDQAAVEELYRTHVHVIDHVLRAGFWTKSRQITVPGIADPDQRADLLQEVFVRAFSETTRRTFDPALDYRSYVLGIGRHLLVDHHRRVNRRTIVYDPSLDETYGETPAAVEQGWLSSDLLQVVDRYVASLRAPLQEVHHARYVLGQSQREAADRLGLSRQNLRTLEERLKQGLRSALLDAWHDERSVRNALEGTSVEPKLASGRAR